jgi:ribosomal-protein-alanine N-acetyltransferase
MQSIDEVRTERLILARINRPDVESIVSLYGDPEVMALLGGIWTAEQTESLVAWFVEHWARLGFGPWTAREAISNHFVGLIGLLPVRLDDIVEVHIGYVLMPKFWRRGLATEATRAIVDIAFTALDFPSLTSYTVPNNLAARRVMEKAGFSFERNFTDEKGVPQVLYRLTRVKWRESGGMSPRPAARS